MEKQRAWFDRFVGESLDRGQIEATRKLLALAKSMQGTV